MAAPSGKRTGGGGGAGLWVGLLLAAAALRPAEAVSEPTTVAFDVRPGGVVHSFSQSVGPGDRYTCVFTYASQGGTNELVSEEEAREVQKCKKEALYHCWLRGGHTARSVGGLSELRAAPGVLQPQVTESCHSHVHLNEDPKL
ncbi:myeloid-derived growth factor isoform X2 [Choloepus didactylus]|uniref:myeloid-derived growth factor isoform X2 n=1 Tax=Choloepus didactylus TaxID=27675 RepID=UPI00189D9C82|nr:myeloid-derived growth factor isoform X2 [Choloepus didactylus]